jgi:hypothetical protein
MYIDAYTVISLIICISFLFAYGFYLAYRNKDLNIRLTRTYEFRSRFFSKKLDFESDMGMINILIEKAAADYISLNYIPLEVTRTDLILNDEIVQNDVQNLCVSVISKLNTEYINMLCTFYFKDPDAVNEYVLETLTTRLIKSAIATNLSKLSKK